MTSLSPRTLEERKEKIRTEAIVKRLHAHIESKDGGMSPSAVNAALGLLRKVLPDLAAVQHSGQIEYKQPSGMTDAELDAAIALTDAQIRASLGREETAVGNQMRCGKRPRNNGTQLNG
jgi:hypothetical protein